MMGVAMPGIAPTGEAAPLAAPARPPEPLPPPSHARRQATLQLPVQYVPPPDPLQEMPAPLPPRIVRSKGGLPLALVGLVTAGLVVVGGAAIAILWKSAPPIAAQPHSTPEGKDILHLTCDARSCRDGTVVTLDGAKATFASGAADLPLTQPLRVGDNTLPLIVDRPGMGRDETLKLVVPVAYRVRPDVTTMAGAHPSITIRVQARPGTDVRIDDKVVALDANGSGAYAVDESAATEGPADESRVVSADVPYVVVQKSGVRDQGLASARVAVAPLRVDAPGMRAVVDDGRVLIAGRAAKGSTVTVDGVAASVGADGSFEATVAVDAPGDHAIEVRASTASLMPRTVHPVITRVANLADAARQFEQEHPIGYDAVMSDLAGSTGRTIVVTGEVVEARSWGHRTIVLVDDKRGCAQPPCRTRVIVGRELATSHGETVSAYGVVARAFTAPDGRSVPEVEAQFVVRARR
jgi:hypothetical protein